MKEDLYSVVQDGKRYIWDVRRLWDLSQNFPIFEFKISQFSGFDIDMWFCGVHAPTVRNVYQHCLRINTADLNYPIILDTHGIVLDGVHRLLKAKTLGYDTIPAVRFKQMPPPDRVEEWPPSSIIK
jgi:hypothetical protein